VSNSFCLSRFRNVHDLSSQCDPSYPGSHPASSTKNQMEEPREATSITFSLEAANGYAIIEVGVCFKIRSLTTQDSGTTTPRGMQRASGPFVNSSPTSRRDARHWASWRTMCARSALCRLANQELVVVQEISSAVSNSRPLSVVPLIPFHPPHPSSIVTNSRKANGSTVIRFANPNESLLQEFALPPQSELEVAGQSSRVLQVQDVLSFRPSLATRL
jgi:hypothetical protein